MDPKFQTSFIPKKPVVIGGLSASIPREESVSIFYVISIIVFIVALLASAGLYGYKIIITKQLQEAETNLNSARDAFDPVAVRELIDVSKRTKFASHLLDKHVAVSHVFDVLGTSTISRFRFINLIYKEDETGSSISADVETLNYAMFSQQEKIFSKTNIFSNPAFSDFVVSDTGTIRGKLSMSVNESSLSYKQSLESFVNTLNQ
jgi:hypothetical protein